MKIRVTHYLDKGFIIEMIALFLESDSGNKTKRDFMDYMREQVCLFGSDHESQFGQTERNLREAYLLYGKWFE